MEAVKCWVAICCSYDECNSGLMPVKAFSDAAGSSVLLLTLGFLNYHGDYKHFVSSQKALSENGLGSQAAGNLEHLLGRLKISARVTDTCKFFSIL